MKPILMRIYCASYQLKLNAFFSKVIVKEAKSFKFEVEGEKWGTSKLFKRLS